MSDFKPVHPTFDGVSTVLLIDFLMNFIAKSLFLNKKKDDFFLYCTDWKTNKPENFIPKSYHGMMYPPFDDFYATTLEHYYVQLPL